MAATAAVVAAVGPDFPVMVDVNNAYYEHTAIAVGRERERLWVWHFEEPLAAHDYDAYARLADSLDLPVTAGEQEYTSWQFRDLVLRGGSTSCSQA